MYGKIRLLFIILGLVVGFLYKSGYLQNTPGTLSQPPVSVGNSTKSNQVNSGKNVIHGSAFAVYDGDTCKLRVKGLQEPYKIRFAGIDAPEKKQESGIASQKFLASLIDGKEVDCVVINTDRYGRKVCRVFVGDLDVNAEMVKNGHAWYYADFDKKGEFAAYKEYEGNARRKRLGLWKSSKITPPWQFRKDNK